MFRTRTSINEKGIERKERKRKKERKDKRKKKKNKRFELNTNVESHMARSLRGKANKLVSSSINNE